MDFQQRVSKLCKSQMNKTQIANKTQKNNFQNSNVASNARLFELLEFEI